MYPFYKRIQDALLNKNIDDIQPLFEERNKELDVAFYHEPGKTKKDIAWALKDAMNDSQRKLLVLKAEDLNIYISPNSRLARLAHPSGSGAIIFNYSDKSASERYDIILRKKKGKWIISR
ncbi:hypothetical protein MNBD_NITROSPIRAE01-254 [hydrothermal vent metagenome]|uniref:DUF4440 domain-containing protein n=1 Tax=hydrothermal vent metagenome TaxID=652676 RepID=A0A3B1CRX8_9ZZZZ